MENSISTQKSLMSKLKRDLTIIRKDWQLYSLLVLPLIYYVIFKYGPMIGNVIAFRKFVPGGPALGTEWVGMKYFNMFIHDATFWHVFKNTLVLSGLSLVIGFPIPIIFALLLNELKSNKFKRVVQTASYLPYFLSTVIVAGLIMQILSPSNGVINMIIKALTGKTIDFLGEAKWFSTVYVGSGVWQGMGWGAILYLAALSGINMELYEAARIDGANRWKQTIHITIPGIMPTIVTLLILNIGGLLNVGFEKILLLYSPLTYSTADVISTYLYRLGLQSNSFSYATAIGLFEAIIGLILVGTANFVSRKLTENSLW
ncbi:ABC transporter permease [Clostridium oryzae]|uniref:Putative multiple-sugar transport system permease YteP n=1 Tax=Clostridium oryzae TaxID=1450648 RepID=A0A1V4IH45_9CLOT|nr:ABC transporter permease subunit [Clostridium oryzae]OPJ59273.1 putative multiple-sugar transport system permease YteP [Clostridium oryzae]